MAIADTLTELATDISNAYESIGDKGGTLPQDKNTNNLATAIDSISTGITPSGTIQITENGTVDVTDYAEANVNVVDNRLFQLLTNSLTDLVDDTITTLRSSACRDCTNLVNIDLPNLTTTYSDTFRNTGLVSVTLPNLASTTIGSNNLFAQCYNLEFISLPKISRVVTYFFNSCSKLKTVVLNNCSINDGNVFNSCGNLKNIIYPKRVTLNNVNSFISTPFRNGTGGTVYTNYDNVSWYETATNWRALESTTFKSIQENLIELQALGYNSTTQEWDYKVDILPYYEIVSELPTSDIDNTIVYFIETVTAGTYEQWFHGSGSWEQLPNITLEEQTNE